MMSSRLSWPARLRPRRRWIIALLILIVVRAALPLVLRSVIASQASKALHARVAVGDVDLALYKLGVALKDVAVYATSPSADTGAASGGPTPSVTPMATADSHAALAETMPADAPLIEWKRFALSVRWLPLFKKTIVLRDVELDSPRVSLDRLADGKLNLMALVPVSGEEPAPTSTPVETESHSGWGFGLDHLILRDGGVLFRDFKVRDSEPIELNIPTVEVTDVYLVLGQYGEPSKVSVTAALDQGSLGLEATLTQRSATENQLQAYLKVRSLPLRRARLYIPKVGWSAMEGDLDADIVYTLDTGTESVVRGSATVGDFAVRVPNLDEPALGWKNLTVKIDPLDLHAQRVVVSTVELSGATLLVRPQGGDLLPFLTSPTGADEPAGGASAPVPTAAPTESAPPWRWSVSSLRIADSRVRLLGADAPVDVGVGLHLTDLADQADRPAHVELALTAGRGSLNADGGLRIAPPGFGGSLKIADLSLPELAVAAGLLPRDQLQAGRLDSDLTVEAGLAASAAGALAPTDVRVHGKLSLADVRAAPPGLSAGARSIDLTLTELQMPGVLPAHHAEAAVADSRDAVLSAGDLRGRAELSAADVNVTAAGPRGYTLSAKSIDLALSELLVRGGIPVAQRNAAAGAPSGDVRLGGRLALADFKLAGTDSKAFLVDIRSLDAPLKELMLPRVLAPAHADAGPPMRVALGDVTVTGPNVRLERAPDGLVLPAFSSAPRPAEGASPPAPTPAAPLPPAIEVTVDSLGLTDGTVALDDRTVKPFYQGGLLALTVKVKKLRWPRLAIGDLRVAATGGEGGKLDVYGAFDPDTGWLEINGDKLALVPFNPYATTFSGYSIDTGKASFVTKVSFGRGRYDASTYLTLHSLDVRGGTGEALFQQQFGIPLSMALALMRDTQGDIGLDIPVTVDSEGTTIGLLTVIRGALQRAILGALASPLKMVGAVFGGDKVETVVPPAIAFRPGRVELTPAGAEPIEQLAMLLASRPGIGITLETAVTDADVRWLREQALREEWAGQGVFAKLKGLAQSGARDRISRALEVRAKDEEGKLDPDDAATLDRWLDERPAIPAEQLRALAAARLAHIVEMLRDQHGIQAERITPREATPDTVTGAPVVRVELGPVAAP